MIVGGYMLGLHCDACDASVSISASTGEKARAEGRRRGWKVILVKDSCFCPLCVKAGLHLAKPED